MMARKKPGGGAKKGGSGQGKKRAGSGQGQSSEEWIDMKYELRKAYAQMRQSKREIEADETYASGRIRERGKAPGRTDGRRYG